MTSAPFLPRENHRVGHSILDLDFSSFFGGLLEFKKAEQNENADRQSQLLVETAETALAQLHEKICLLDLEDAKEASLYGISFYGKDMEIKADSIADMAEYQKTKRQ